VTIWLDLDERDDHYLGLSGAHLVATESPLRLRDAQLGRHLEVGGHRSASWAVPDSRHSAVAVCVGEHRPDPRLIALGRALTGDTTPIAELRALFTAPT
jgi:hypothetical protein